MSSTQAIDTIDYPESDGQPMGETDLHRDWMVRILDILRYRYRGQPVYVASNLLLYYEEGRPSRFVVPDNFVVLECDPGRRRTFKTWEEGRTPDVVFEVTSRGTYREDLVTKLPIYEQIGVREYFLYDPSGVHLRDSLQGFRLVDGALTQMVANESGGLACQTLGVELSLDDEDLVMVCTETGQRLLTEAEAERREKEAAWREQEVERRAKESEAAGRLAAEAEVKKLLEEIQRLKRG